MGKFTNLHPELNPLTALSVHSLPLLRALLASNSQHKYMVNFLAVHEIQKMDWSRAPAYFHNSDFLARLKEKDLQEALDRPAFLLQNWTISSYLTQILRSSSLEGKIFAGDDTLSYGKQKSHDFHMVFQNTIPIDEKHRMGHSRPKAESNHIVSYYPQMEEKNLRGSLELYKKSKYLSLPKFLAEDPSVSSLIENYFQDPTNGKNWLHLLGVLSQKLDQSQLSGTIPPLFLPDHMPLSSIRKENWSSFQEAEEYLQRYSQVWAKIEAPDLSLGQIIRKAYQEDMLKPTLVLPMRRIEELEWLSQNPQQGRPLDHLSISKICHQPYTVTLDKVNKVSPHQSKKMDSQEKYLASLKKEGEESRFYYSTAHKEELPQRNLPPSSMKGDPEN